MGEYSLPLRGHIAMDFLFLARQLSSRIVFRRSSWIGWHPRCNHE